MPNGESSYRPQYSLPMPQGIATAQNRYKQNMIVALPIQNMFPTEIKI